MCHDTDSNKTYSTIYINLNLNKTDKQIQETENTILYLDEL